MLCFSALPLFRKEKSYILVPHTFKPVLYQIRLFLKLCYRIAWTVRAKKWSKLFTHIEHRARAVAWKDLVNSIPVLTPEYSNQSHWVPVLFRTYSLLQRSEYLLTLHQSGARNLFGVSDVPLLRSARRNHRSHRWTNGPVRYEFHLVLYKHSLTLRGVFTYLLN